MKDSHLFLALAGLGTVGAIYLLKNNDTGLGEWLAKAQEQQTTLAKTIMDTSALQSANLTGLMAQLQAQAQNQNTAMLSTIAQMFKAQSEGIATALGSLPQTVISMPNITMPSISIPDLQTGITQKVEDLQTGITQKVEDLQTGITQKVEDLQTGITQKVEDAKNTVTNPWAWLNTLLSRQPAWDWAQQKLPEVTTP